MSDNEKRSHWESLASDLGAKDAADPPPVAATPEPPVRRPRPTAQTPPPAPKSDWNSLASDLGIEVPEAAETAEVVEVEAGKPQPAAPKPPSRSESRARSPKSASWGKPRRGESESVEESAKAPSAKTAGDDTGFAVQDADVKQAWGLPPEEGELPLPAAEAYQTEPPGDPEPDHIDDVEIVDEERDHFRIAEELAEPDPSDSGEAEETTRRRRRRRRRGRRGRGESDGDAAGKQSPDAEESSSKDRPQSVAAGAEVDELGEASEQSDQDSEGKDEQSGTRRRRRRRRRRGGQRDASSETTDPDASTGDDAPSDEDDSQPRETVETEVESERKPSSGGSRRGHQNIPTWDETIAEVVQANLDSRSKSPASGRSGGSRGRRGRGRKK